MTKRQLTMSRRRRDSVTCDCGAEILLLPDVKAMGQAIEVHVAAVHMPKLKDLKGAAAEAERVRDALIAQFFSKLIKSENDGSHKEEN